MPKKKMRKILKRGMSSEAKVFSISLILILIVAIFAYTFQLTGDVTSRNIPYSSASGTCGKARGEKFGKSVSYSGNECLNKKELTKKLNAQCALLNNCRYSASGKCRVKTSIRLGEACENKEGVWTPIIPLTIATCGKYTGLTPVTREAIMTEYTAKINEFLLLQDTLCKRYTAPGFIIEYQGPIFEINNGNYEFVDSALGDNRFLVLKKGDRVRITCTYVKKTLQGKIVAIMKDRKNAVKINFDQDRCVDLEAELFHLPWSNGLSWLTVVINAWSDAGDKWNNCYLTCVGNPEGCNPSVGDKCKAVFWSSVYTVKALSQTLGTAALSIFTFGIASIIPVATSADCNRAGTCFVETSVAADAIKIFGISNLYELVRRYIQDGQKMSSAPDWVQFDFNKVLEQLNKGAPPTAPFWGPFIFPYEEFTPPNPNWIERNIFGPVENAWDWSVDTFCFWSSEGDKGIKLAGVNDGEIRAEWTKPAEANAADSFIHIYDHSGDYLIDISPCMPSPSDQLLKIKAILNENGIQYSCIDSSNNEIQLLSSSPAQDGIQKIYDLKMMWQADIPATYPTEIPPETTTPMTTFPPTTTT